MPSAGAGTTRREASLSNDGHVLPELAEIDSRLRDLGRAWKDVAQRLERSRRELAVATVQLQRARSLAARRPRAGEDESNAPKAPAVGASEQAQLVRLFEQFEAELTEAEARRLTVHDETQSLRRRRQAALRQLPPELHSPYEAAVHAGRVPVLTTVADGTCAACRSGLPTAVVEAVGGGAVMVCRGCERLLCPSP